MNSEKVKELKKALECCKQNQINETCKYCDDCPSSYKDWIFEEGILECDIDLLQKSLILIKELESEVEDLKCELQKARKETATELTVNVENMLIWVTRNNNAKELYEEHLHKELKIIAKEYGVEYQEDFDL